MFGLTNKNKYEEGDMHRVVSLSLKFPLHNLNKVKQDELMTMEKLNTDLANSILRGDEDFRVKDDVEKYLIDLTKYHTDKKAFHTDVKNKGKKYEVKKPVPPSLTSKHFNHINFASGFINQTLRNCRAKTKVKSFKRLPLETNNQNWELCKVGEFYSVRFNLYTRENGTRIPFDINVHNHKHVDFLERAMRGEAKLGSLKIYHSRKGVWYVLISISYAVELNNPKLRDVNNYIGVDRGERNVLVMIAPNNQAKFVSANHIKHIRTEHSKRRSDLQRCGKHKQIKKIENKEKRIVLHENHKISKQIVEFAKFHNAGIRFEDLTDIRKCKQRKKTKSQAKFNRDFWAYFQLETLTQYKANMEKIHVEFIPAPFTSQTCSRCGVLGQRSGIQFKCVNLNCMLKIHADLNASRNISQYMNRHCVFDLKPALPVIGSADHSYGLPEPAHIDSFVIPEAGCKTAQLHGREKESPRF